MRTKFIQLLLNRYVVLSIDLVLAGVSFFLAFWIRSEFQFPPKALPFFWSGLPFILIIQPFVFYMMATHKLVIARITFEDSVRLLSSIGAGTAISGVIIYSAHGFRFPRSIFILYPLILACGVVSLRYFGRLLYERRKRNKRKDVPFAAKPQRILIMGAGNNGIQLVRALRQHSTSTLIGFLDDEPNLSGKEVCGLPILGNSTHLEEVVKNHQIQTVIMTMAEVSGSWIRQQARILRSMNVTIQILPRIIDVLAHKNPTMQLRELSLEDLLRREPIETDLQQTTAFLGGKVILVTGAAGSIGSEICRQLIKFGPKKLIMVDVAESPLFSIQQELLHQDAQCDHEAFLLDITQLKNVKSLFENQKPDIVFHAAAYKHVPMLEHHPFSGMVNNLEGGKNVIDCCVDQDVEHLVLISTDKAVNPTNLMGMTKRVLESYALELHQNDSLTASIVRFGNVLGSQGSLIPTFERQLKQGGPLTVTHPEITRFFMTIPEATQLVIQAAALGSGGDIFVLDMGEPVRIYDLAKDFIELNGFKLGRDVEISIIGLRPGEKLFEELYLHNESQRPTTHPKILKAVSESHHEVSRLLEQTLAFAKQSLPDAFACIQKMVPEAKWEPLLKFGEVDKLKK